MQKPVLNSPCAHRRLRMVKKLKQRPLLRPVRNIDTYLKIPLRLPVKNHIVICRICVDTVQMRQLFHLRIRQVSDKRPGRLYGKRHLFYPETLKILCPEMLLKSISCRISPEQVIIKIIHIYALLLYLINKHLIKLKSLRHHAFLGREPGHLSKKLSAAFKRCGQKTACRYISQAYPERISISKNRYDIII